MQMSRQLDEVVRLDGRRILVTGAASGIGRAVATLASRLGAAVALADLSDGSVLAANLAAGGGRVVAIGGDLALAHDCRRIVAEADAALGGLDGVVTAAGIVRSGTIAETPDRDFDDLVAVNWAGTARVLAAALPVIARSGGGSIVTIASEQALKGVPAMAAYASGKAAIVHLTRCIAVDHARDGVRANCVCPGPTLTPMLEAYAASTPAPETTLRLEAETTLLERVGLAEEVANAVVFLLSGAASYITGTVLPVDGGATAKCGGR